MENESTLSFLIACILQVLIGFVALSVIVGIPVLIALAVLP